MTTANGDEGDRAGYALDIIVVRHPGGRLRSSDWHVVFRGGSAVAGGVTVRLNGSEVRGAVMRAPAAGDPAVFEQGGSEAPCVAPLEKTLQGLAAGGVLAAGRNEVLYELPGGGGGVLTYLYLWESSTPAVVFDIDGTVTQSDVVGHVGQAMGVPFTHRGVCEFACRVSSRGYAVFFLSARPLAGPTGIERTRRFLFGVSRDAGSGFGLPHGPVLTTPHTSTMSAIMDEVVTKKSAKFKTAQLRKIAALYEPPEGAADGPVRLLRPRAEEAEAEEAGTSTDSSPVGGLYAGFGNRAKDATAYIGAGIAASRIFIINERSSIVRWAQPEVRQAFSKGPPHTPLDPLPPPPPLYSFPQAAPPTAPTAPPAAPLPLVAIAAEAAAAGGAVGELCQTWQGYGGMQGSLEDEFPLRCLAPDAARRLDRHTADAAERLSSAGAPKADPCGCFRDMLP